MVEKDCMPVSVEWLTDVGAKRNQWDHLAIAVRAGYLQFPYINGCPQSMTVEFWQTTEIGGERQSDSVALLNCWPILRWQVSALIEALS